MTGVAPYPTSVGLDISVVGRKLCDGAFSGVIENLLEGYVVIGGTGAGQAGMYRQAHGIDFVWDLWNEQFSAFTYPEHGLGSTSLVGASAGVHVGFGTGRFDGVHDAWSGEFRSVEYSVDIRAFRLLQVSGQAQGFTSPDGKMVGGLIGVGGSASVPNSVSALLKLPLGGSATAAGGFWTPHDDLTRRLTPSNRKGDLVRGGRYTYLNLEEGELGVASHMIHLMGPSPFSLALASLAVAVAMAKRNMEDKGIADRAQGLRDLHLTLCSTTYRRISQYRQDVPNGTTERHYDDYSVQRTTSGKFIITETHAVPATGEWRSTRRLHSPDGAVLDSYRYGQAISNAPNGFIEGRSYPTAAFTQEIGKRQQEMMRK